MSRTKQANSDSPLVSVIIPTYNRKAYVQEAIDSVLAQTYPHYEIIVIDDGSTDGTGEALAARYGDRIIYHWQENQGESAARNWGIAASRGEYVGFLDDDDVYLPKMLEVAISSFDRIMDAGVVSVQGLFLTLEGELTDQLIRQHNSPGYLSTEEVLFDSLVMAGNSIVKREATLKVGKFDESIKYNEDVDLFLRIAVEFPIYYLSEPLVAHRVGELRQGGEVLNLDKAIRRYADIEKIWAKMEVNPIFEELLPRTWAQERARFGLIHIANGNIRVGESLVRRALQIDENYLINNGKLYEFLVIYMIEIARKTGIEAANAYFKDVNNLLDKVTQVPAFQKRKALGDFNTVMLFSTSHHLKRSSVASSYINALWYNPRNFLNRGLHKTFIRCLMR